MAHFLCVAVQHRQWFFQDLWRAVFSVLPAGAAIWTFVFLVKRKLGSLVKDSSRAGFCFGGTRVSMFPLLLLFLLGITSSFFAAPLAFLTSDLWF